MTATPTEQRLVHLLIDGYHRIACCNGSGAPNGDDDTSTVSEVTCLPCLRRSFSLYEALTEAIAVRLVELGETKL